MSKLISTGSVAILLCLLANVGLAAKQVDNDGGETVVHRRKGREGL